MSRLSSKIDNNNNNNNNNIVMKWRPPGIRKRGRPKATCAEWIRRLMGEKGLIEEDWKDRDKWKKKIR